MTGKSIYIGCLMLFCGIVVSAQDYRQSIQVSNIELQLKDQKVTLKFSLQAGRKVVKSDYDLIIQPVLRNKNDSLPLPEIVIQGNRALIAGKRHMLATGQKGKREQFYTENGGKVVYSVTTTYQDWMQNSQLVFNGIITGCCSVKEALIGVIVDRFLPNAPPLSSSVSIEKTIVEPEQPLTTADRLSNEFHFLSPLNSLNQSGIHNQIDVNDFIDNNPNKSLTIYFVQGNSIIDRKYNNNNETLVKLISVIRIINASADSRIARIVIAGFASPEGSLAYNKQLAWDRGTALRRFVVENTPLAANQVYVYNGTIDWGGLRKLVSSSKIKDKYAVLDIIDNPGTKKDNRLNRLISLNGGDTYRYMLNNFFPLLRNAAYVKVYYENL